MEIDVKVTLTENTTNPIAHLSSPNHQNCIINQLSQSLGTTVPPVGPLPSLTTNNFPVPSEPLFRFPTTPRPPPPSFP
jgi:hypothetical protein